MSDRDNLVVVVKNTRADYFSGLWTASWHTPSTRTFFICLAIVIVLGDAYSFYMLRDYSHTIQIAVLAAATAFWLGCGFGGVALRAWIGACATARLPANLEGTTFELSPQGLYVKTDLATGQFDWKLWRGAFENEKVVVLLALVDAVQVISKRNLEPNLLASLRAALRSYVKGVVRLRDEGAPL